MKNQNKRDFKPGDRIKFIDNQFKIWFGKILSVNEEGEYSVIASFDDFDKKFTREGFSDSSHKAASLFFITEEDEKDYEYDPKSRYYSVGGIEVLQIIKAKLSHEQYCGYLLGNILKYACRLNWKGVRDRDIEKIKNYSQWLNDTNKEKDNS